MRCSLLALTLCIACGGAKPARTPSPSPSSPHEPRSSASADIGTAIDDLVLDPWKGNSLHEVVAAFSKVLGSPATVEGKAIVWYTVEDATTCSRIGIRGKGEYSDGLEFQRAFAADARDGAPAELTFDACKTAAATRHRPVPPVPPPTVYDLAPATRAVFAAWSDRKFADLFAQAAPSLQEVAGSADSFARWAATYAPLTGKVVKVDGPFDATLKDYARAITGKVTFEKGTASFGAAFEIIDGKPRLAYLLLTLPDAMRMKPDPAVAQTVARKAVDAVLGDKFSTFVALTDPALNNKLRKDPALAADVRAVVKAKLGKVRSVKLLDQHACDDDQCLLYKVTGTKGTKQMSCMMRFVNSEWQVSDLQLE